MLADDLMPVARPLDRDAVVYVAGHRGLVGSAIWRHLEAQGFTNLVGRSSSELDLRDRAAVAAFFAETRPQIVFLAAAKVGGIMANSTYPADFLSDNLQIQVNVMDAAAATGVERLLFLGSSCIYPKFAPQPIHEDSLLTGALEPTNDAYAIAKIAGILQVQSLRRQHQVHYISAMPTNLYGPGDNFDPDSSHVIPALIKKCLDARARGDRRIEVWGDGSPTREFLYVEDAAEGIVLAAERYNASAPVNIGSAFEISIKDLVGAVAAATGFTGEIAWDTGKPNGQPRRKLDVTRAEQAFGFRSHTHFAEGLRQTVAWYQANRPGG